MTLFSSTLKRFYNITPVQFNEARERLCCRRGEQDLVVPDKLANSLFSLPNYSLIVVDEAGMIGNGDNRGFLSVAASRKYDIILSGDDRQ